MGYIAGARHTVQEVIPVHGVKVRIRVPAGQAIRSVYLAPDGTELAYSIDDGRVEVEVPRLDIHSMVVVETGDRQGGGGTEDAAGDKPWFETCWRRWFLEFNARDEPPYLVDLDAQKLAGAAADAGVNWYWVHGKDNGGTVLFNMKVGHKHEAIGERDFLREFTDALTAKRIRWGFHVNVNKDDLIFKLHPEWRQKWQDGTDRGAGPVNPDWNTMCYNSAWRQYITALIRELAEQFEPEGFWFDRFDWGGVLPQRFSCACTHCQVIFRAETGHEIPRQVDWGDPAWRAFVKWRSRCLTQFFSEIRTLVKTVSPRTTICLSVHNAASEMFGYWFHGQDIEELSEPADMITQETHSEREGYLVYSLAPRFTRAMSGGKHMDCDDFRHGGGDPDYALKPLNQLAAETFTLMANGSVPFYQDLVYAEGTIEPHVYSRMKPLFDQIRAREPWMCGARPVPYAAVFFSKHTRLYYGRDEPGERYLFNFLGACKTLLESHVLFDIVTDRGLNAESLAAYHVLLLPNAVCLSDRQLDEIRRFVDAGGRLVSTFMTSMRDEEGNARPDFGLADVFGTSYLGVVEPPRSYVKLAADSNLGDDLPRDVPLLHRGAQLKVQPADSARPDGLIVYGREGFNMLNYESLPPMPEPSPFPAAVLAERGRGRSAYFPGQPDAVYLRWDYLEHKIYLRNGVKWVADETPPLDVDAPMCVEATLYEQPDRQRLIAHLVNFQSELGRTWDLVRERFVA